jgi:glycosyltransferase involved in cell wall biosynthesis
LGEEGGGYTRTFRIRMKLSIVVNTIKYDRCLYRTVHNIYDLCCDNYPVKEFEIIIVGVGPKQSEETELKFIQEKFGKNIRIVNAGKKQVSDIEINGKYTFVIPSGSILGKDFFEKIKKQKKLGEVYIPEYQILINYEFSYIKRISSSSKEFTISSLLWNNCFGNVFYVETSLLKKYLKILDNDSIWAFFSECISNEIQIITLENTVLFEEDNPESRKKEHLLGKSSLLNVRTLKKIVPTGDGKYNPYPLTKFKKNIVYRGLRYIKRRLKLKNPFKRGQHANNVFFKHDWFQNSIEYANKYSARLQNLVKDSHVPQQNIIFDKYYAKDFCNIKEKIGENVEYVIFCPWLKMGGAEKVVLNLIRGLNTINAKSKITLISLRKADAVWASKLPENIVFIDLGNDYNYTEEYVQIRFLATLLYSIKPQFVFNIGAYEVFEMYKSYGEYLSKYSKFCPFFFSSRKVKYNRYESFGICYANEIFDYSYKIFSDNKNELTFLTNFFGFAPKDKMQTLYQPADILKEPASELGQHNELKVLWASRLDREKHPEILLKIAKKTLDLPIKYIVYGNTMLNSFNVGEFNKVKNIRYMGGYSNGVQALNLQDIDLFMYTSEYDGMPNVILEAISVGLPVLSSNVGGISEIIEDGVSGFLVNKYDDVSLYVDKLKDILKDKTLLKKYALKAQKAMREQHSEKVFAKRLEQNLSN